MESDRPQFDFMTDEEFRTSLLSDYQELQICIKNECWKAAHVLAGSIIEAILIDYLRFVKVEGVDVLKLDLGKAIEICKRNDIISEKVEQLAVAVKLFRNLIHPGRQIRLNEKIGQNSANIALALANLIADEISENRKKNFGYTAEQIVTKLAKDVSSISIIEIILKEMHENEIERLLIKVIPENYFEFMTDESVFGTLDELLKETFHISFNRASETTRANVANRFVKILKEESGYYIFEYEKAFFRGWHLQYLSESDQKLVKKHLLDKLADNPTVEFINSLEGIGNHLIKNEIFDFTKCLVSYILGNKSNKVKKDAMGILIFEISIMNDDYQKRVIRQLERIENGLRNKQQLKKSGIINSIRSDIQSVS